MLCSQWTNPEFHDNDPYKMRGPVILLRVCLGISGMKGNEGHWGGGISIISQNFSKSPSILLNPPFPKQALSDPHMSTPHHFPTLSLGNAEKKGSSRHAPSSGGATYLASHGGRQTFPPTNPPTPTSLSPADRQSSVLRRRHGCWDSLVRR
jgi:hypothetical protein